MLQSFSFPLLILENNSLPQQNVRVYFDDSEVSVGVVLGDVLNEELDIDIPNGSCIVMIGKSGSGGLAASFAMTTEVLHAAIVHGGYAAELSLFEWALRSLTEHWSKQLCTTAREVERLSAFNLSKIIGYDGPPSQSALRDYIQLLEPNFQSRASDPDLARILKATTDIASWWVALVARFEAAAVVEVQHRRTAAD